MQAFIGDEFEVDLDVGIGLGEGVRHRPDIGFAVGSLGHEQRLQRRFGRGGSTQTAAIEAVRKSERSCMTMSTVLVPRRARLIQATHSIEGELKAGIAITQVI